MELMLPEQLWWRTGSDVTGHGVVVELDDPVPDALDPEALVSGNDVIGHGVVVELEDPVPEASVSGSEVTGHGVVTELDEPVSEASESGSDVTGHGVVVEPDELASVSGSAVTGHGVVESASEASESGRDVTGQGVVADASELSEAPVSGSDVTGHGVVVSVSGREVTGHGVVDSFVSGRLVTGQGVVSFVVLLPVQPTDGKTQPHVSPFTMVHSAFSCATHCDPSSGADGPTRSRERVGGVSADGDVGVGRDDGHHGQRRDQERRADFHPEPVTPQSTVSPTEEKGKWLSPGAADADAASERAPWRIQAALGIHRWSEVKFA
ncbi:unnamed protein product [Phytophthora lilii]|uniref:Unnamed protein product n=1 Tax=Phytophthora lilii TaxID=2077276 RepID=A0A9W6X9Y0_9STRA|nr:unnamed protein product [Phytophthora lilii]